MKNNLCKYGPNLSGWVYKWDGFSWNDPTRKADKQEIWQAQLQARGVDKDIGEGERDGEWGRGAGSGSGGMRINPFFNALKFMSHDVNRRYYAIWSIYTSVKISRILLISVIDVRVENLKYQMHDIYFQNIQGLCFLLVPVKPLHLDGAESNSSLNFDTFSCNHRVLRLQLSYLTCK